MRWTRRRVQTVTTWVIVVAWVGFYAVALAHADLLPPPETAVMQLVVPHISGGFTNSAIAETLTSS
jgi:hypothetical protein